MRPATELVASFRETSDDWRIGAELDPGGVDALPAVHAGPSRDAGRIWRCCAAHLDRHGDSVGAAPLPPLLAGGGGDVRPWAAQAMHVRRSVARRGAA
ncbi:hypothetical protein KF840_05305 [bacterium]|nr:hypothetical protein [bacterium]